MIPTKIHTSPLHQPLITQTYLHQFIHPPPHIILLPSIPTLPPFHHQQFKNILKPLHPPQGLLISPIPTSQQTSHPTTITHFPIPNKICPVHIQHIRDP
ncbi:DUF7916 family protein, partial [Staphylococcus saprophyticus]